MKKNLTLICLVFFVLQVIAQEYISIIPEPVKIKKEEGHFNLPSAITLYADDNPELKTALTDLTERLTTPTGYQVTMTKSGQAVFNISLNKTPNQELGKEGYQLTVTAKSVHITANQPAGIYYT